ncbi:AI-2E family transporter [Paraferrimonas sp. SM1919]|uniref:AI-2E family transporter n=1 Tax=Paraferrimonas sp. SM1919 TaxID=2662263 RepID=UPI0013D08F7C|nr:AI-2E family transporter [Paraferrimonas sp. SM1919]
MHSSQPSMALKTFVLLASLFIVLAGIKLASTVVIPFILSVFIAVLMNPMVVAMGRIRIPKVVSIIIIMTLLVLAGMWLGTLIGSSIKEFTVQLPSYRQKLVGQFTWVLTYLAQHNIILSQEVIFSYLDPAKAMSLATNMLSGVGGVMGNLFLIILTVIFMLFEAQSIPNRLHLALDDPQNRLKQIDQFLQSVNQYMVIKTMVSLGTGAIVGIGLWIIGVDYVMLWAVIAFLLNYIPNIGSIIAAVPAVAIALIQLGPGAAGATALLYLVANTVMGNVIEPRFMGKGLGLSTLVVFLSLIFWGWLLGSVGMLLSVPLTMVVKIALESSENGKHLAVLLSDKG